MDASDAAVLFLYSYCIFLKDIISALFMMEPDSQLFYAQCDFNIFLMICLGNHAIRQQDSAQRV